MELLLAIVPQEDLLLEQLQSTQLLLCQQISMFFPVVVVCQICMRVFRQELGQFLGERLKCPQQTSTAGQECGPARRAR